MKLLLLSLLIAQVEVNSCNDRTIVDKIKFNYNRDRLACLDKNGIPISEPVLDSANSQYYERIIRCDFPQSQGSK